MKDRALSSRVNPCKYLRETACVNDPNCDWNYWGFKWVGGCPSSFNLDSCKTKRTPFNLAMKLVLHMSLNSVKHSLHYPLRHANCLNKDARKVVRQASCG